jgi:3-oxoacyl-[acyl-carrier protein] reductase
MDLGITGRVALVAAASSGLGLAVAKELAREGAHVALCARDPVKLEAARAQVDALGAGQVRATALDLRDHAAAAAWVESTAETFGGLHIVVTNTSNPTGGPASTLKLEDYRSAFEGVLLSTIAITQAALPHLRTAGWGRLLFITSETVKQPVARYTLSSTSRLGIVGYAKCLVQDLGDSGVTVNVLAPGYHRTPLLERYAGADVEAGLAAIAERIPLKKLGRPEDFAALVAFLASERAAFITGTVQLVDGGNTLGF